MDIKEMKTLTIGDAMYKITDDRIGDLEKLTSEKKTSIVDAINEVSGNIDGYETLSLQLHTDGLVYIFKNGEPIGAGISITAAGGDVIGNVDSANNIVLTGNLPVGTYTIKYEMSDGSTVNIGTIQVTENDSIVTEPIDVLNTYEVLMNQRYSRSSGSIVNENGVIAIAIPMPDLINKSIRLSGFEYGLLYADTSVPKWYLVNNNNSDNVVNLDGDTGVGFWDSNDNNLMVTAQSDGSYLCTFPSSASYSGYTLWILLVVKNNVAISDADLEGKSVEMI